VFIIVRQGNGCFAGWAVSGVTFNRVRALATHCGGVDGRGKPSSGALVFAGGSEGGVASTGLRIAEGSYSGLCAQNLVWPASAFAQARLAEVPAFTPRRPVGAGLQFCWEDGK
jgi:hypothetical protein